MGLLEGYRSGKSTSSLAELYSCSPNTVSRIVKALLPVSEYTALKAARAKGDLSNSFEQVNGRDLANLDAFQQKPQQDVPKLQETKAELIIQDCDFSKDETVDGLDIDKENMSHLALEDADDFDDDIEEVSTDENLIRLDLGDEFSSDVFQEVVPLSSAFEITELPNLSCEPLKKGVLPSCCSSCRANSISFDLIASVKSVIIAKTAPG